MECRQVCGEQDNLKLRMWNFELVALRAMKNYSIKNYHASYSMFLLDSPNLCIFPFAKSLERDGRGLFLLHLSITSLTAQTFLEKTSVPCTENPNEILFVVLFVLKLKLRLTLKF